MENQFLIKTPSINGNRDVVSEQVIAGKIEIYDSRYITVEKKNVVLEKICMNHTGWNISRPLAGDLGKLRAEKKALRDAIKRKRLQDVADTASAEVDTEKQKLTEADSNDEQNPWGEDSDDEGKAATDGATGKRLTKKEKRALKWQRRDTKEWSVQQHAKLVQQALAVKHSVDGNKPLVPIEACFVHKWLTRKEEKNTAMTEAQRKRALRKEIYGKRNQSERGKKKRGASSQSQSHGQSAAKDTPRNYVTKKH